MIPRTADAVIIGGGAMGLSTAYYLSLKGCTRVVVLEKESCLGGHTTSRCAGGFRHQFSTKINVQLSMLSMHLLEHFDQGFDYEAEFNFCGYLFMLTEGANVDSFQSAVQMQREQGIHTEYLSGDRLRREFPMMRLDDVVAGTYYPRDGLVTPDRVTNAYISGAKNLGVRFFTDTPVTGIGIDRGKVNCVSTPGGTIHTPVVVNAAGPWASRIGHMVDACLPVKPVMQQVFLTDRIPWVSREFPVIIFPKEGLGFHSAEDGLLTGMNKPDSGCDGDNLMVDRTWEMEHCEKAMERIPSIGDVGIRSRWAGFYEVTPDDHPILGRIPQIEGFYCIAGFSGHGFMHSPAAGLLVSEEILDGKAYSLDTEPLRLDRFYRQSGGLNEFYKL